MELTTFLAQLWGPGLLAFGLGFFMSREYYVRVYKDLDKATLAVLVFGMAAIAAGLAQVTAHSVWNTLPEIVVSLLGWGLLAKGTVFAISPKTVDRAGNWWGRNPQMLSLAGAAMLLMGAYLSYVGYMM